MRAKINIIGQRFGKLLVIGDAFPIVDRRGKWWERSFCICDCGKEAIVTNQNMISGGTKSCGCIRREVASKSLTIHGKSKHPLFRRWRSMIGRCHQKSSGENYEGYGARGIKVCDRWRHSFPNFLADMESTWKPGLTIERKDNDGNYCPENCEWITIAEQARNRRTTLDLTFNGKTMCCAEWSRETGISISAISRRLKYGWSVEETLTVPSVKASSESKLPALQGQQQALQEREAQHGTEPNDNGILVGRAKENCPPADNISINTGDHSEVPAVPG